MKKLIILFFFTSFYGFAQNAKVMDSPNGTVISNSGGTDIPYSSSILDVRSTTKAVLLPRMTTTNRDAISSPVAGMLLYNSTSNQFNFHDGTSWQQATFGNQWNVNGVKYYYNGGNVGIGTTDPINKLHVVGSTYLNGTTYITGQTEIDAFVYMNSSFDVDFDGYINRDAIVGRNLSVSGTSSLVGNVTLGNNATIDGSLTVDNGKGVVRSSNSSQLRTTLYSSPANINFSLGPGGGVSFPIAFSTYASVPVISVGQWASGVTNPELILVTVESVTTTGATINIKNVASSGTAIGVNAVWRAIIVGVD